MSNVKVNKWSKIWKEISVKGTFNCINIRGNCLKNNFLKKSLYKCLKYVHIVSWKVYTEFICKQLSIYISHLTSLVSTQCPGFLGGLLTWKGWTAMVLETKLMDHTPWSDHPPLSPWSSAGYPTSFNSIFSVIKAKKLDINWYFLPSSNHIQTLSICLHKFILIS